jgi:signal-transduction protein with cAMP-binding, CBS, and nucleotidyltransferase domain
MNSLLSTKARDVTTWRAVEDFSATYRQVLHDMAASGRASAADVVFSETVAKLENSIKVHEELIARLHEMIGDVAETTTSAGLKELVTAFYSSLYRHFDHFRSATVFYQLSMEFLRQTSNAIFIQTKSQLGLFARHLPEMTLIALGPAGRSEYSLFCQLQFLLVYGDVDVSLLQTINLFCQTLHEAFAAVGLDVDPEITPRNPAWRGTLAEWQQRFENALTPQTDDELFSLCRLADQAPLYPAVGIADEFKQISSAALSNNRTALTNLVARMASLSNGIGLMGRLKLERGGEHGLFRLLDHGLLPLSAALSILAIIKNCSSVSNGERIRDILNSRELDVELAERMLTAWHNLHGLRLLQESRQPIDDHGSSSLLLNMDELTSDQRQMLKKTLEVVASIQRHVEITFSGMEE